MRRCFDESDLSAREVLRAHAFERRINRRGGAGIRRGTGRGNSVGAQGGPVLPMALLGLRSLTNLNNYITTNPGGEPGTASGFGVVEFVSIDKLGVARFLMGRGTSSITTGWAFFIHTTNLLSFICASGTNASTYSPGYTVLPSDIGKILCLAGWLDASVPGAAKVRLSVSRTQIGSGTAIVGFAPLPRQMVISGSAFDNANHATDTKFFGGASWLGNPSEADVHAYVDASRDAFAAGAELPRLIGGASIMHRIDPRQALVGQTVVDGQVGPATIADTISYAPSDAMGRVGSPTVVVIDPSVDGRKSYGVQGFSAANYFIASVTGIRFTAAGGTLSFVVQPAVIPTASRHVVSCYSFAGNSGFSLAEIAGGYRLDLFNAASVFMPGFGTWTVTAADLNMAALIAIVYTGTEWRLFVNGVQMGADKASSFMPNTTSPMVVGNAGYSPRNEPYDSAVFALCGGSGPGRIATNLEIQQQYAAFVATGRLVAIPDKTDGLWDFTMDVDENGGPENGIPAICKDRVGVDHLTRVGTGLTVAQRVERTWGYESSPILYGATMPTPADSYESALGFAGDNAGFWALVFIMLNAQGAANVSTAVRTLFSRRGAANGGWDLSTSGPNGMLAFGCGGIGGAGKVASSSFVLSASDVGKMLLAYGVWDGPAQTARLYVKRAQVGTGTVFTGGTFVPETGSTFLGRRQDGQAVDSSITIYGAACGLGVPTLAEIQAHHDDVMANERLLRGIPGKTSLCVDLTADVIANGGALPAQALDRVGSAHFARNGNPTLARQYARAWGW